MHLLNSSALHPCALIFRRALCLQARCQVPAKLALQEATLQPVTLQAEQPGQPASTAVVTVPVANLGNTSLTLSLGLERRNGSVLIPYQWLDPGSGYQELFSGNQGSCSNSQVHSGLCLTSSAAVAWPN